MGTQSVISKSLHSVLGFVLHIIIRVQWRPDISEEVLLMMYVMG